MIFFFDLHDNMNLVQDTVGDDLNLREVPEIAAALVADHARRVSPGQSRRVFACEVRDERGEVVHRAEMTFQASSPVRAWIAMAQEEVRRRAGA